MKFLKPFVVAALTFATPAIAADAPPPPCCVLHLSAEDTDTILRALMDADIKARTTLPIANKIQAEAGAQAKAIADWNTAHQPKPAK